MNTVPITVLVDDREKAPYTFSDIEHAGIHYEVTTIAHRLIAGDYSLPCQTGKVAVERKSLADLIDTVRDDDRRGLFSVELHLLSKMESACVLVEEDWRMADLPVSGRKALCFLVESLQDRYPLVMWSTPSQPGRRGGETATFLFLLAFHDRLQKEEGATPPR